MRGKWFSRTLFCALYIYIESINQHQMRAPPQRIWLRRGGCVLCGGRSLLYFNKGIHGRRNAFRPSFCTNSGNMQYTRLSVLDSLYRTNFLYTRCLHLKAYLYILCCSTYFFQKSVFSNTKKVLFNAKRSKTILRTSLITPFVYHHTRTHLVTFNKGMPHHIFVQRLYIRILVGVGP